MLSAVVIPTSWHETCRHDCTIGLHSGQKIGCRLLWSATPLSDSLVRHTRHVDVPYSFESIDKHVDRSSAMSPARAEFYTDRTFD